MSTFTVKATYRNETRKFTFPEPCRFPSYKELCEQLNKVFPLSHSFYLQKLLFSPNTSADQQQRRLIGLKAHSSRDYATHVARYQGRTWPGAILWFTVVDENSEAPSEASNNRLSMISTADSEMSGATVSEAATQSSTTAVESSSGTSRVDDRMQLLVRLRDRTANNASSVPSLPTAPHIPPLSDAPSLDLRAYSRPLPRKPSVSDASTATTPSVRTVRPSLRDLLSHEPPTEPSQPKQRNDLPRPSLFELLAQETTLAAESTPFDRQTRQAKRQSTSDSSLCEPLLPDMPAHDDNEERRAHRRSYRDMMRHSRRELIRAFSQEILEPQLLTDDEAGMSGPSDQEVPNSSQVRADSFMASCNDIHSASRTKESESGKRINPELRFHYPTSSIRGPAFDSKPFVVPPPPPPLSSPGMPHSGCSFIVPPPPILYPSAGMSRLENNLYAAGAHGPVAGMSSHSDTSGMDPLPLRSYLRMSAPQPAAGLYAPTGANPQASSQRDRCNCSIEQGKEDVKVLLAKFFDDLDGKMKNAFGDDWERGCLPANMSSRCAAAHTQACGQADVNICPAGSSPQVLPPPPLAPPPLPRSNLAPMGPFGLPKESSHCFIPPPPPPPMFVVHPPPLPPQIPVPAVPAPFVPPPPVGWPSFVGSPTSVTPGTQDIDRQDQAVHQGIVCDNCNKRDISGVRFKCMNCMDFDLCSVCVTLPSVLSRHPAGHSFFVIPNPEHIQPFQHTGFRCDGCEKRSITGVRHKCMECEDFDFCEGCISSEEKRQEHNPTHHFFPVEKPGNLSALSRVRELLMARPEPAPAQRSDALPVHTNVICDVCNETIVGIRHKCLDCPDYDMCSACIAKPEPRAQHGIAHQFFEIDRPGEVIVHTVFSGDGEHVPSPAPARRTRTPEPVMSAPAEPAVHNARCNLCDSRILGDRYKCMNCPDFDTCSSCFAITPDQHPDHGFVRICDPEQVVTRNYLSNDILHDALCNVCHNRIEGIRYKCMHPSCSDFDLCQACEALPIPVHPPAHPLLKMKATDTLVPAVQRPISLASAATTPVESEPFFDTKEHLDGDNEVMPEMAQTPFPQARATLSDFGRWHTNWQNLIDEMSTDIPLQSTSMNPPPVLPVVNSLPPSPASVVEETQELPLMRPEAGERLVDVDDVQSNEQNVQADAEATFDGLTTPSDVPASTANSIPRLSPVDSNMGQELWPEMTSMLKHLLQLNTPKREPSVRGEEVMPGAMILEDNQPAIYTQTPATNVSSVDESPLVGEPLLCRPLTRTGRPVADLSRGLSSRFVARSSASLSSRTTSQGPQERATGPAQLYASFLSDVNIPDGQVFPPGAEFVKSWRMINQGTTDWPANTELIFVAGDRMAPNANAPRKVKVGAVRAGAEVEIVAGEMKAPDVPGKYVSYWRLGDGEGNQFGHSVWVDITVAEMTRASSVLSTADHSLASSSVIMPHADQERGSVGAAVPTTMPGPLRTPSLSITVPSSPSDDGSFDSEMSLVDAPSSPLSDDDEVVYQDSRSQVMVSPAERVQEVEYVMLYDSASEDD